MATNIDDLELDEPPTVEPYEVLGIQTTATQDQIKTAYRKAALKWHPDKAAPSDKEIAHTKFQEIALAYAVLSDERRRTRYDNTGRTDESLDIDDDIFNWSDFYRAQFANAVTEDTITSFTAEYKGSDEEKEALLAAYTKYKGDMGKVYQQVMVSNPAVDEERFRGIINEAIENEDVEAHVKFTQESQKSIDRRIAAAKEEHEEADEHAKKLGLDKKGNRGKGKAKAGQGEGDLSSLAAMIQQRNKGRSEDFLDNLAEKYGAAPKKKGKKRAKEVDDEPPEEAFEKMGKRKSKRSKA
ncbi:DnaJ-domain-containing protein [Aureobasidium pullulans]|uniref:DnaJ-domain-containing protein n=1 Tax=Aureobasidium pullulans TaxID=5580 RepID=A0A4S8ZH30_AURPU|nr:DnaJ-domain-containing protein [Aureobasidium pullulans]THY41869.1 DnaJ-domain-containing protein [Aureobasidium pullulans]THZ30934.1 DnaJ-domain-containing protein [Aureobasidium pullulans]